MGDVLAPRTVAASRALLECTVDIQQADGRTIEFRFCRIVQVFTTVLEFEPIRNSPVEIPELFLGKGIIQRQHRQPVFDRPESFDRLCTNTLRRRVRRHEFRELLLHCLQLPNQPVILYIRNFGGIENVIEVVMVPDLLAQGLNLGNDITGGSHGRDPEVWLQATLMLCSNWMTSSRI